MSKSFSVDWFSSNIPYLQEYLAPIAGHPHIHALEVGSFEGRSTTWFLDTILTHPTSHITCVDTFKGSPEHEGVVETDSLLQRFSSNIKRYQNVNRITVFQQTSEQFFIQNVSKMQGKFDFI